MLVPKGYQIARLGPMQPYCMSTQLEFEGFDDHKVVARLGARLQNEDPLEIEGKELTVDRSIDEPRGIDAVAAQGGNEGQGFQ